MVGIFVGFLGIDAGVLEAPEGTEVFCAEELDLDFGTPELFELWPGPEPGEGLGLE